MRPICCRTQWPPTDAEVDLIEVADVNGDGLQDLVVVQNGQFVILQRSGKRPDLLTKITDGYGAVTTFGYEGIGNRGVYTPSQECVYPQRCINGGLTVVAEMTESTATDPRSYLYGYETAVEDMRGKGFLGFKAFSIDDVAAQRTTRMTAFGFTGHRHDVSLALINMRGRIYDPATTRFLAVDPLTDTSSSQGLNPYSYVVNNPIAYADPSGFCGGYEEEPCAQPGNDPQPSNQTGAPPISAGSSSSGTNNSGTYCGVAVFRRKTMSSEGKVLLELSADEALVLIDWLHRFNAMTFALFRDRVTGALREAPADVSHEVLIKEYAFAEAHARTSEPPQSFDDEVAATVQGWALAKRIEPSDVMIIAAKYLTLEGDSPRQWMNRTRGGRVRKQALSRASLSRRASAWP